MLRRLASTLGGAAARRRRGAPAARSPRSSALRRSHGGASRDVAWRAHPLLPSVDRDATSRSRARPGSPPEPRAAPVPRRLESAARGRPPPGSSRSNARPGGREGSKPPSGRSLPVARRVLTRRTVITRATRPSRAKKKNSPDATRSSPPPFTSSASTATPRITTTVTWDFTPENMPQVRKILGATPPTISAPP